MKIGHVTEEMHSKYIKTDFVVGISPKLINDD